MLKFYGSNVTDRFHLTADADADTGIDSGAGAGGAPPADTSDGGGAEGGADRDGGSVPDTGETEPPVRRTVREELAANFKAANEETAAEADKTRDKDGKFVRGKGGRVKDEPVADGKTAAPAEGAEATPPTDATPDLTLAPPAGLAKEALAEWAKVPPVVQAAVNKRLADSAKGVEELKTRYADIDSAFTPHDEAIRKHGHTRAQATAQLFGWFQALAANPKVAFPALVKSFGLDQNEVFGITTPAAGATVPAEGAAVDISELPAGVQKLIDDLNKKVEGLQSTFKPIAEKVTGFETNFQSQNEQKAQENLAIWSKGKTHFESVRARMAQLINTGVVPLKNGNVDLDAAYETAIWADPEVRAKVLAEQAAATAAEAKKKEDARKRLQQEQADKARRAGVSVASAAPGGAPTGATAPKAKGKSVRESLNDAVRTVNETA